VPRLGQERNGLDGSPGLLSEDDETAFLTGEQPGTLRNLAVVHRRTVSIIASEPVCEMRILADLLGLRLLSILGTASERNNQARDSHSKSQSLRPIQSH